MPSTWTGDTEKNTWFHWQDGWFFHRLPDGTVCIIKRETANDKSPVIVEAKIPPAQWASIVAAVSQFGDMGPIHQVISALHGEAGNEPIWYSH